MYFESGRKFSLLSFKISFDNALFSFFCDTFLSFIRKKERKVSKKNTVTINLFIFYTFISFLLSCASKRKETKHTQKGILIRTARISPTTQARILLFLIDPSGFTLRMTHNSLISRHSEALAEESIVQMST